MIPNGNPFANLNPNGVGGQNFFNIRDGTLKQLPPQGKTNKKNVFDNNKDNPIIVDYESNNSSDNEVKLIESKKVFSSTGTVNPVIKGTESIPKNTINHAVSVVKDDRNRNRNKSRLV
jgi:hypothetical protein